MTRLLLILLAAVLVAGCGGSDEKEAAGTPSPAPTAAPISSDLSTEPQIPKPAGQPPAKLVKEDVVEGKGPRVKPGDKVSVQYTGVAFSTGQKFDASWDRGAEAFSFRVGAGAVIPGWDRGIPGMRVGGRRVLTIPARLAYGAAGSPPAIGPDETLVFVVDLVSID